MEEEFHPKPSPDVIYNDYNIADYLIIGYKSYFDEEAGGKIIGIYTTLSALDFITVDYNKSIEKELENIIDINNQFFREGNKN